MSTVMSAVSRPVQLAERINRIEPSATMAAVAEADKLRQQGIDVVDATAGEPHFTTPEHIKEAAIAAIRGNFSRYTPVGGTTELKDAIIKRHATDFGSAYKREETCASVGGKHALFNAISVLVDHGDEVILPVPYWVSFKDMVNYVGGKCVLLKADEAQGFRVTAQMVARLVTPKTKLIILNSPSNPSGAVMSPEDMTEVVRLAHERGIWVISDECYVYFNYTGKNFSVGSLNEYRDQFLVVGIAFENLRHDRLATGIHAWPGDGCRRDAEAAEPADVESHIDCAEGSGGGLIRLAAVRGRHARGIYPAARSHYCGAAIDSRREVHDAGGRVLRVSECVGFLREERDHLRRRRCAWPAAQGASWQRSQEKALGRLSTCGSLMRRRWRIWIRRWRECGSILRSSRPPRIPKCSVRT